MTASNAPHQESSWLLVNAASSPPVPVPVAPVEAKPLDQGDSPSQAAPAEVHPEGARGGAVRSESQAAVSAPAEAPNLASLASPNNAPQPPSSDMLLPLGVGGVMSAVLALLGFRTFTSRKRRGGETGEPDEPGCVSAS